MCSHAHTLVLFKIWMNSWRQIERRGKVRMQQTYRQMNFALLMALVIVVLSSGCNEQSAPAVARDSAKAPEQLAQQQTAFSAEERLKARKELAQINKQYSEKEFFASAADGDQTAIELYLAAGMDINSGRENYTVLCCAIAHKQWRLAKMLIDRGANVECDVGASDCPDCTPLTYAIKCGQDDVASALLAKGARIRSHGANPLQFALSRGQTNLIALLLTNGADTTIQEKDGETALMTIVRIGDTNLLNLFLMYDHNIDSTNEWGQTAADIAAAKSPQLLKILVAAGAKFPSTTFQDVWRQQIDRQEERFEEVLQKDLSEWSENKGYSSLEKSRQFAVGVPHLLRDDGVGEWNVAQLQIRLAVAVMKEIEKASGPLRKDLIHLWGVCGDEYKTTVLQGIEKVPETRDLRDGMGFPPLFWAVSTGRDDIVKAFIDKRADVNASLPESFKDDLGSSILEYAEKQKHQDVIALLKAAGAKPRNH